MLPLPYQSLLLFQLHYSIYKLISLSYSSSYLNPFCLSVSCPDHHFLFSIQFFYQSPIPPVYFLYLSNFQQLSPVHSIICFFHIYKAHIYCFSSFNIPFTYCPYYTNCISCSSSSPKSILFLSSILLHFPTLHFLSHVACFTLLYIKSVLPFFSNSSISSHSSSNHFSLAFSVSLLSSLFSFRNLFFPSSSVLLLNFLLSSIFSSISLVTQGFFAILPSSKPISSLITSFIPSLIFFHCSSILVTPSVFILSAIFSPTT